MVYYKNLLANERGIPLDAAIVIGGPPCITYAAVQPVPDGVDEVALAGGLARGPLEMVRWKTVDLEVPAHADIVIEGRISSDYLEPDGPFGEAHGYLDSDVVLPGMLWRKVLRSPISYGRIKKIDASRLRSAV